MTEIQDDDEPPTDDTGTVLRLPSSTPNPPANAVDHALANKIIVARTAAQLTPHELANRLGLQAQDYTLIELAQTRIDAVTLSKLALELNRPIAWFFDQQPKNVSFPLKGDRDR